MTEAEWLSCANPLEMLRHLDSESASTDRLLRYALECCRRIDHLITDPASREAVQMTLLAVEGRADWQEQARTVPAARAVGQRITAQEGDLAGAIGPAASPAAVARTVAAMHWADLPEARRGAESISVLCQQAVRASQAEAAAQAALLRDLFGNPFQPSIITLPEPGFFDFLRPARRAAREAQRLAREISSSGKFAEMPRLGELLRAAGCTDQAVLSHCARSAGHVPGCWVLYEILEGKAARARAAWRGVRRLLNPE
jgi:hypothetical protein